MYFGKISWVFPWSFIVHLFGLLLQYLWRLSGVNSEEKVPVWAESCGDTNENSGESCGNINENSGESYSKEMVCDQNEEKEVPELECEEENVCNASSSTSKYEFVAGNSVCAFIEEPQIMNFTVHEMFVVSYDESFPRQNSPEKDDCSSKFDVVSLDHKSVSLELGVDSCTLRNNDCDDLRGEEEVAKQKETESSVFALTNEVLVLEQNVCDALSGDDVKKQGEKDNSIEAKLQDEFIDKEEKNKVEKIELFDEPKLSVSDSDEFWASIYEFDGFLCSDEKFDYDTDEVETQTLIGMGNTMMDYELDSPRSINHETNSQVDVDDGDDIEMELEAVESPYIELVPQTQSYCSKNNVENQLTNSGFEDSESDQQSLHSGELKGINDSMNGEEEETMASDVVMEQKELIRKMKKEIRQLKIIGLPTILEESVSPRVEQDLRPLKIDEKIGYKDLMDEIQTFYKRYLDKMKKLDIWSQQTMYAIDLALSKNVSNQFVKTFQAKNLLLSMLNKHKQGSDQKYFRDLELVYVSQLCLSWEILKWQHYKAEELQVHDPIGFHQHDQVAGEFQKFQVLLHRFIEDEPYHQGTRVQQFVNTRHGLPALLQVPLIKEDLKRDRRKDEDDGISVNMLKEIIGSSMHSFWDFVHADKFDVYDIPLIGIHWTQSILQEPSDAELLTEIRLSLHKKDKRLKDLVRTGNCLMKKFKKYQDKKLSHEMLVAQVELRLVSRVLSMPKVTTDQLLWCHKKLNKIDIIGKSIYLESSFLLFPC